MALYMHVNMHNVFFHSYFSTHLDLEVKEAYSTSTYGHMKYYDPSVPNKYLLRQCTL